MLLLQKIQDSRIECQSGQGLMEYALIISLISLAVMFTMPSLRDWLILSIGQIIEAFS